MKRTHHLSSDNKTSSKQSKPNTLSNKPILQPLPKAGSPVLSKNFVNYEDQSPSPRLDRGIKSQISFLYSPKTDNLRYLVKDGINNKSPLVQTERSQGHNDYKSNHFESITSGLYKSQKDVGSHLNYNKEKSNQKELRNLSLKEKKLLSKQNKVYSIKKAFISEENKNILQDNFLEIEEEQTLSDDPENLKRIISEQSTAYMKLEEMYCQDTSTLKTEIERLKSLINFPETDITTNNTKTNHSLPEAEAEVFQNKLSSLLKEKETLITQHEEILAHKTSEIFQMNELIQKLKIDRKLKDDSLKDLQKQVLVLTSTSKLTETELSTTKRQLALAQELSESSAKKNNLFEMQTQELTDIRNSNSELEQKLKELQKSLDFVHNNYKILQNKFNDAKEELQEKDYQLQETMKKCNESNSPIKSPVKLQLKRTITINSSNNTTEAQKDSWNRLYLKISNLEEELNFEKIEKDKILRNLEYSKKIIEEKSQIVAKLEEKIQDDSDKLIEVAKLSLVSSVIEILNNCEKEVLSIQEIFTCHKCAASCSSRYISWDCKHIFCKPCAMSKDSCPCCSSGSRVLNLKLLKTIYPKLQNQLKALNGLRQLFNANSQIH